MKNTNKESRRKPALRLLTGTMGLSAMLFTSCASHTSLQQQLTRNDRKIDKIIAQMTLEEKVEMLHSKTNMSSEGVPRLGIQDIKYADGPFGIREEGVPNGFASAGWTTDSATYFPTGSALAATWSPEMAYKYGTGMGREARLRGKDVILGPAINIQRLPVGGRSYEYLSEDPFLAAQLAAQYVRGTQDQGTAACIKHFALNNQETNRGSVNVICDERTMRELYLKPFEAAVKEGGAMVVMPAYNKVNGFYCSENEHLLNEILRGEWGFRGFTVSDWGGTHSTMGAALHGLNVQMTGSNYLGQPLIDSVSAGKVPEKVVDDKVRELLRVRHAIKAIPAEECNLATASQPESRQIAYEVATKSIVMLKNEQHILPLKSARKIAVIGLNAKLNTQSGGMGAGVKAPYEVTPLQGLQNRAPEGISISYAPGYKNYAGMFGRRGGNADSSIAQDIHEAADPQLLADAVALARQADVVIYVCGTNKNIETEGSDRSDIKLPVGQDEIVKALAAANPNIVSVVISGGPCDLVEVNKHSRAVVQGWWNGLEGGNALADIIYGRIAPSGKLPFTFPIRLEDSPAYAMGNFPQKAEVEGDLFGNQYRQDIQGQRRAARRTPDAHYSEGMLVGYRWFDTKQKPVLYAFGHGLSYVDFSYANLTANKKQYKAKDIVTVSLDLSSTTSSFDGKEAEEVVQLYVRHLGQSNVAWPSKELKAFQRVSIRQGETKRVKLQIPVSELRYWDEKSNAWQLQGGQIELLVGGSSDQTPLSTIVEIDND